MALAEATVVAEMAVFTEGSPQSRTKSLRWAICQILQTDTPGWLQAESRLLCQFLSPVSPGSPIGSTS
jgi:hypothetical protein